MFVAKASKSVYVFWLFIFAITPLWAQNEIILSQMKVGECSMALQANLKWKTITLQARQPDLKNCKMNRANLISLIKEAVAKNKLLFRSHEFTSIFIGRAVEFPWLSSFLSEQAFKDSLWNRIKGHPKKQNVNRYVETILYRHPVISQLDSVMQKVGYRISGVSVEKVLVGRYQNLIDFNGPKFKGGLPFDAQVYLILKKE